MVAKPAAKSVLSTQLITSMLLLAVLLMPLPAKAAPSYPCPPQGWEGTGGLACKYAKGRVVWSGSSIRKVIEKIKFRGGTASQWCDPSNDVVSWFVEEIKVIKKSTGKVRWKWGPSNVHYNCDVDGRTFAKTPGLTVTHDNIVRYKFYHGSTSGDFSTTFDILVSVNEEGCSTSCEIIDECEINPLACTAGEDLEVPSFGPEEPDPEGTIPP